MKKGYLFVVVVLAVLVSACGAGSPSGADQDDAAAEGSTSQAEGSQVTGLSECVATTNGTVCGILYAADGVAPLADAEIRAYDTSSQSLIKLATTDDDASTATTTEGCYSNASGEFACACPQTGAVTFFVSSSLINLEFDAECGAEQITEVAKIDTTATSTSANKIAVVTGAYDKVEVLLATTLDCGDVDEYGELDYGSECDNMHIFDGGSRIDSGDLDPNNGNATYRTEEVLLTNLSLMQQYDIIFLNCGMDDGLLWSSEEGVAASVMANIVSYVDGGGQLYGSDWAYDYIEQSFPDQIDFYGDTEHEGLGSTPENLGEATVGDSNWDGQAVNIIDSNLLTYLQGKGTVASGVTTADVIFDLGGWVVMSQVADGVDELLNSAGLENGPSDALLSGHSTLPIAVRFCETNGGGVFFGSYHTEMGEGTSADDVQEDILRYMILNGFNACQ